MLLLRLREYSNATGRLTEEIDYYGQSRRYAYDPAGHLIRTTDPLGQALSVACDAMGRITRRRVEREDGQEEQYAYNRRGQLTEARNACRTVRRMYDVDGRLTTETQQQPQTMGTLEYAYDAAGRLQTQRRELKHLADEVCSQQTVTYGYDAAGQVQSVQIDAQEPMRFCAESVETLHARARESGRANGSFSLVCKVCKPNVFGPVC
ncbi:RHS repeat domain-containing protein [Paraburkholderia terrae]|uniref:RHS repeat domain-containing protein n=1 Tax=Paraburkholderia terrae TaxID=311230 RepID=UPI00296AA762|nr:hypothetical protein [Paraburkholderia terrae]MDW3655662.1 hypothetical protein [Paraburkholderia terrae]